MRFRLAQNLSTLDDLERLKRPLVEVNKNSNAHQKNFNEDRPISLLAKCRLLHLFAINIKCMQICVGVPSEKVYRICHLYLLP